MHLPFLDRQELPHGRKALVDALAGTALQHGFVHGRSGKTDLFLFVREGRAWCAGLRDASSPCAMSVTAFLAAADSFESVALCRTDLPLFLCAAVLFRKPPAAHVPAALVDGEALMNSLRVLGKDAVLAVQNKDGACALAFCLSGEPVALYAAPVLALGTHGTPKDRLLELVYASPGDLTLDVYDEIRLPPAPDAGQALSALAHDKEQEAHRPTLVVLLGDRVVFRHRLDKAETLIGRGEEADLALDNLSISRRHAIARVEGERVIVEDLGSENGLVLEGELVKRAVLTPGEMVGIGKYKLAYTNRAHTETSSPGRRRPMSEDIETVNLVRSGAFLEHHGKRHKIASAVFTIGSAADAHLRVRGFFVSPIHAVLQPDGDGYRVERIGALRALRVNGVVAYSARLVDGDEITVAGQTLRFRASPFPPTTTTPAHAPH